MASRGWSKNVFVSWMGYRRNVFVFQISHLQVNQLPRQVFLSFHARVHLPESQTSLRRHQRFSERTRQPVDVGRQTIQRRKRQALSHGAAAASGAAGHQAFTHVLEPLRGISCCLCRSLQLGFLVLNCIFRHLDDGLRFALSNQGVILVDEALKLLRRSRLGDK